MDTNENVMAEPSGPTLVILAAGLGSRYGGLKQIDPVGPNGETIVDYAVYDAVRAGFQKVVFVIRRDFENDFRRTFVARYEAHVETVCVMQDLPDLPEGYTVPADRVKPWGTAHAVWVCRKAVTGPFAVINADDFYGRQTFDLLTSTIADMGADEDTYALIAFDLAKTLSEHGPVSRGICDVADGLLRSVTERKGIERIDSVTSFRDGDTRQPLRGDELVSMNTWAFGTSIFPRIESALRTFLENGQELLEREIYLPAVIDALVQEGRVKVRVARSEEKWFGMTYPADKPHVTKGLELLTMNGTYPQKLWQAP